MSALWCRFLDWLTGRRVANFMVTAVGHINGPVRHVCKWRDQFIVITDREVYSVYYDYEYCHAEVRRIAK